MSEGGWALAGAGVGDVLTVDCHRLDLRTGSAVSRARLGEVAPDRRGLSGGNGFLGRATTWRERSFRWSAAVRHWPHAGLLADSSSLVSSWPCRRRWPGRPSFRCCRYARTRPPSIPPSTPTSWKRSVGRSSSDRATVESLPLNSRATAVVFTRNYGEAGALEWYGLGRPVFSGHNAFGDWGPPLRAHAR